MCLWLNISQSLPKNVKTKKTKIMTTIKYIDKDFVTFKYQSKGQTKKEYLAFGDKVEVLEEGPSSKIRATELWEGNLVGTVKGSPFRDYNKGVMKFSMIDVQQGDGMILETPPDENHKTKIIFIDGGENKLFARHAAARFRHRKPSIRRPLPVDLMLITHGDQDHFKGLTYIRDSEEEEGSRKHKRLFIKPKRIYHNGLVKYPSSKPDEELFGATTRDEKNDLYVTELYNDTREASNVQDPNRPFKSWHGCIDHWEKRNGKIVCKRIAYGMNAEELFGFMSPLKVAIHGPFVETLFKGTQRETEGLKFLKEPKKSSLMHVENDKLSKKNSAKHTINGHSITLKISYGNVRINLTGDHNNESMDIMKKNIPIDELEAEIIKAPHHGSADFDLETLKAMSPVVSLISSGDETESKEHIHPRATLLAALGKASRGDTAIILCTELVAFFKMRGYSYLPHSKIKALIKKAKKEKLSKKYLGKLLSPFFAFERTNFGIINIRTDGERVLVFTHSGKEGVREAYSFNVDENHKVTFNKNITKG